MVKKVDRNETLDESNYREMAKAIVKKYFDKGMVLDGMVWSRIVAHYEDEIERLRSSKTDALVEAAKNAIELGDE